MTRYIVTGMIDGLRGYFRNIPGAGAVEFVTIRPGAIVNDQHFDIEEMRERGVLLVEMPEPREPGPCD